MDLFQQLSVVALVLALLGGALWLLQRNRLITFRRAGTGVRQIEVIERVAITQQHSLALVRVNGITLLVGTGPGVCEIRNVEVSS